MNQYKTGASDPGNKRDIYDVKKHCVNNRHHDKRHQISDLKRRRKHTAENNRAKRKKTNRLKQQRRNKIIQLADVNDSKHHIQNNDYVERPEKRRQNLFHLLYLLSALRAELGTRRQFFPTLTDDLAVIEAAFRAEL
jgi:hypothetical protein